MWNNLPEIERGFSMALREGRCESGGKVDPAGVAQPADRRRFAGALLFSLCLLVAGMMCTLRIGQDNMRIYHHLYHAHEGLEGLRAYLSRQAAHSEETR